jgi:hypothetical protein
MVWYDVCQYVVQPSWLPFSVLSFARYRTFDFSRVALPELGILVGLHYLARAFLGSLLLGATGYRLSVESCSKAERTFLQWVSKLILLFQNLEENIILGSC